MLTKKLPPKKTCRRGHSDWAYYKNAKKGIRSRYCRSCRNLTRAIDRKKIKNYSFLT